MKLDSQDYPELQEKFKEDFELLAPKDDATKKELLQRFIEDKAIPLYKVQQSRLIFNFNFFAIENPRSRKCAS